MVEIVETIQNPRTQHDIGIQVDFRGARIVSLHLLEKAGKSGLVGPRAKGYPPTSSTPSFRQVSAIVGSSPKRKMGQSGRK